MRDIISVRKRRPVLTRIVRAIRQQVVAYDALMAKLCMEISNAQIQNQFIPERVGTMLKPMKSHEG